MRTLLQDLRYGLRMVWKRPGFTVVAIITLALGIGANTAIFSVVNAILLRPLPYKDAERLVMVWGNFERLKMEKLGARAAEFVDYRDQNRVFEDVAAFSNVDFNLTGIDEPERIVGCRVTANLFSLLGAQAVSGRTFLSEENQAGRDNVAVVSHGLWQRRFGSDPKLVGKTIALDGRSYNVIGIMPADFQFPYQSLRFAEQADLWVPAVFTAEQLSQRSGRYNNFVIARLKPDVSLEQARADMSRIARQLEQQHRGYRGPKGEDGGWRVTVVPLHEEVVGETRLALLVLLGAVGFVLLIACANVANLLLARAAARRKEFAIRAALGAGRFRLIQQLLIESMLLGLLGGALGLLLAGWGVDLLVALSPGNIPRIKELSIDFSVLGFTLLVSLASAVVFGLAPALQISRTDVHESLKEGGRSATGGVNLRRLRSVLVISEVALALVLLVGAGLMIKSFLRLQHRDPGFDPTRVLTVELALSNSKYPEDHQKAAFYERLLQAVETLPGVQSASMTSILPLNNVRVDDPLTIEGRSFEMGNTPVAGYQTIGPNYFRTMRIPLISGRDFTSGDAGEAARVAIINKKMASTLWPNEDPIGKRFKLGGPSPSNPWITIVGVTRNLPQQGADSEIKSDWYRPHLQSPNGNMYLVVRTSSDPLSVAAAIRSQLQALDKDQPITNVGTMEQTLAQSVAPRRFNTLLLGLFASVALVLAAVGIYGVMAYSVTQRTHEIGIRMALGAQRGDVLKLVVGQAMLVALFGLAVGLGAAFALTRVMASLLYGVSATDPIVFAGVSLLLTAVALVACYIPARRATKVDPLVALRYE